MQSDWPPNAEMGQRIKEARRAKGITGHQLARTVGVTQSMISKLERGVSGTSTETMREIASALGVAVATLLGTPSRREWMEVPPELQALRRTLREDEWPACYRGPAPEYWPGTLREFVSSKAALKMRLVPDEVSLLAKSVVADGSAPVDDDGWKAHLSTLRIALGIKGRPVFFEMEIAEGDSEDGAT